MKFKSSIFTQASGSIGGTTFAHNQGGLYTRARSIPVNPNTAPQNTVRNAMAVLMSRWVNTLTAPQRTAWATYADNVLRPGPLGDDINIGAVGQYTRSNVPRVRASLPAVNDAPTTFNVGGFTSMSLAVSAGTSADVSFTDTDDCANEDAAYALIYLSEGQNTSRNFWRGPYRFAGVIAGNSTTPPTSPETVTSPFTYVAGQRVFGYVAVSRADGRYSNRQYFSAIVT